MVSDMNNQNNSNCPIASSSNSNRRVVGPLIGRWTGCQCLSDDLKNLCILITGAWQTMCRKAQCVHANGAEPTACALTVCHQLPVDYKQSCGTRYITTTLSPAVSHCGNHQPHAHYSYSAAPNSVQSVPPRPPHISTIRPQPAPHILNLHHLSPFLARRARRLCRPPLGAGPLPLSPLFASHL